MPGRGIDSAARGLTLVEILVAVAIVAVLASISYPSYLHYVTRAKRAEAQAHMYELMQQQERYFTRHNTYLPFSARATDGDAARFRWHLGSTPRQSGYEFSGRACEGTTVQECIELLAEPGTNRVDRGFRDPRCGTLRLNSTGVKGADDEDCW